MKLQYIFIVFLLAVVLGGCGKSSEGAAEGSAEPETAAADVVSLSQEQVSRLQITLGKVEHRQIGGHIRAIGMLDVPPQNMVSITAPFGGFLQSSTLLQGSRVSKGQLIATLQDPEFVTMQQQYLEDRSQLSYLQAEFERQSQLSADQVNARKSLEKAKADYEGMKARIAGERAKLEMLNLDLKRLENGEIVKTAPLYAPIAGFVTQVNVNIGTHVRPEDVMFKIADTGHLHAELTVYEQDLPMLYIGQKVRIRVSNEEVWRNGEVHLIGREVGADRSVKVHVHLDEEEPELVPGTFLEAEIAARTHDVMAVPSSAIAPYDGGQYIFVAQNKGAQGTDYQMVGVKTGASDSAFVEVTLPPNFNLGSEIVTQGSFNLLAKLKNAEEE